MFQHVASSAFFTPPSVILRQVVCTFLQETEHPNHIRLSLYQRRQSVPLLERVHLYSSFSITWIRKME